MVFEFRCSVIPEYLLMRFFAHRFMENRRIATIPQDRLPELLLLLEIHQHINLLFPGYTQSRFLDQVAISDS